MFRPHAETGEKRRRWRIITSLHTNPAVRVWHLPEALHRNLPWELKSNRKILLMKDATGQRTLRAQVA